MAIFVIACRFDGVALSTLKNNLKTKCQHWWFAFGLALMIGSQFFPEALLWQREKILGGEYWRLLTGHWLHLNTYHFLLNLLTGLILVIWVRPHIGSAEITLQVFLLSLLLSLCLLLFVPQLEWYGGLSGILHGLLCLYSIRLLFLQRSQWWAGILILVWIKIAFEHCAAGSASVLLSDDFPVVLEAHLFGALLGTLVAVAQVLIMAAFSRE